jgi:TusA-related sulfurtransferase
MSKNEILVKLLRMIIEKIRSQESQIKKLSRGNFVEVETDDATVIEEMASLATQLENPSL